MKALITPNQIRKKLRERWERGYYLKRLEESFPLTVSLPVISSSLLTEEFSAVRSWVTSYRSDDHFTPYLQWTETNHRLFGRNRIPRSLNFDTPEDLARFLGKMEELHLFLHSFSRLSGADRRLEFWGKNHPLDLIRISGELERLITLYLWMVDHPRPGIYLRQIDIPGIDTKFTETYKSILSAWLDLTVPQDLVDTTSTRFERRFGLTAKPELIRFRFLDPSLYWRGCSDISIPSEDFAGLYGEGEELPVTHVFVVENDISALSFPRVEKAMVIFGRGYNFSHWRECRWLNRVKLFYWGDLDTHGFRILDQFRSVFPHTRSFLMDWKTLQEHEISWGEEGSPTTVDLHHLTRSEEDLYDDLRFNRIHRSLRLEQEFIRYSLVEQTVGQIAFRL